MPCWVHFYLASFSYTSRDGFIFIWWVSVKHSVLASFLCRSFSETSRAGFIFIWEVCLTHPMLADFFFFLNLGSFFYTSRAGFIFIWGVSLKHPVLASFLYWYSYTSCAGFFSFFYGAFVFYEGWFSYISRAGFFFFLSFLSGEFLLHIPRYLHFYLRSFSYTSRAGFNLTKGLSLTHPMLASVLSGEFLLHIPSWLRFIPFHVGSLSWLLFWRDELLFLCSLLWRQFLMKRAGSKLAQKKSVKKSL